LASLAYGLNQIDTKNFFGSLFSASVGPFLLISLVLIFVLARVEARAEHPILPGYLFKRRQMSLTYALSAGAGLGEASLVFMPLLAVVALGGAGISEKNASWLLMPVVLAMVIGSPLAGRLLDKFGSRPIILSGTAVMTVGMFLLSQFAGTMSIFILSGVLIGLGLSALLGAPVRYIMLNEANATERSVAQGVVALFSSIGQLSGSALVGAAAASRPGQALAGYATAFLVVAIISALLVVLASFLKSRSAEIATVQANEQSMAGV